MNRTENIEKIRAACIKANAIGPFSFSGKPDRPIRLADVLLAISRVDDERGGGVRGHGISSDGRFTKLFGDAGESGCNWLEIAWNLYADSLDEQSDETISFLAELL